MSRIFSFGKEATEKPLEKSLQKSPALELGETDPFMVIDELMQEIAVLKSYRNPTEEKADEFVKSLSEWLK